MKDAPLARPFGPDDAAAEHFVYIDDVIYSHGSPAWEPIQANFFACHLEDDFIPRMGEGPYDPVRVVKNVYNLTPVFTLAAGFVVTAALRDLLASCCTVEFCEVVIDRAFWFPYGPCDRSYELAAVNLDGRDFDVMARFATAYACPSPREKFFAVITFTGYLHGPRYKDTRVIKVGDDAPEGFSVYAKNAEISREMIQEHGIVFAGGGHACRPDVYELLNPYLHRPWYWTQRYRYPD